ncbi:amino acid transporter [Clostridium botulinum]|uniref:amino acid transporter n=1 Tax=Clostridium botulinum TaxID=1491 RepID=UPI001E557CF3|nr:amino acid transporter [Clostridium botulinum]MCC5422491.1 amino acid transporter [Clostridium botulinum]
MKKLFIKCNDKSKATYTMKDFVDHMEYVNKYINKSYVESIVLQQYPKKDNEPIIYK